MRIEREFACDDWVLAAGEKSSAYARELVAIARQHSPPRFAVGAAMANSARLDQRVLGILDPARSRGPVTAKAASYQFAVATALLLGVAATSLIERSAVVAASVESTASEPAALESAIDKSANDTGAADVSKPTSDKPAETKRLGSILGKVVDPEGKPVAVARVTLYRYESGKTRYGRSVPAGKTTISDQEGAYRFQNLDDGLYMMSIERTGFARDFCDAAIKNGQDDNARLIVRPPAVPLILVTDGAGRPVAGATVRSYWQNGVNGHARFVQVSFKGFRHHDCSQRRGGTSSIASASHR